MSNNEMKTHNYKSVVTKVGLAVSLLIPSVSPLMANAESAEEKPADKAEVISETKAVDGQFVLPIMHMNDTHAHVENYPYVTTLVKSYREANPNSLLLHGGDVFSGTLYFNEFKGQADLALLNLMDFDAMVFGNHEFDLGDVEDGHKSLSEFVKDANFPMLGANSDFSKDPFMKTYETNKSVVKDAEAGKAYNSIIVERDGEEIGIFGLTTEDTENISSPMSVTFSNYITSAKEEVQKLKDANINKIVALTHLGHDSAPAVGNDLLLAKNVDDIDVVVGGHSHTEVKEPVEIEKEGKASTIVLQGGQYAENLGTAEITFNDKGEVINHSGKLLPIEEKYEKVVDPDVMSLGTSYKYKVQVDKVSKKETGAVAQKVLENPRASSDAEIDAGGKSVRANETALGNLVTDAMLAKSREKESDIVIAVQNGGGIRTSIDKGNITNGEVINVLPFGNNPVVVELSGAEIKDVLEHAVRKAPYENGGFLHISGMKYYYDSTKAVGDRVVKMYLVDEEGLEKEIKATDNYKITTNGFTGQGGDDFETFEKAFEDGRVRDLGESDWEQLVDYMVNDLNGVVDPEVEGRITDLKGEEVPEANEPGKTGWEKADGKWFLYDNGEKLTGWEKVNGTWYYMNNSGAMQTGWEKVDGTWYYMNNSGAMQTGWEKVDGTWYYMNNSGAMQTGWEKVNGTWYLLDNSGAMQTGWIRRAGSWYYTDKSGAMQTGWIELDGEWYYLHTNGRMRTGWVKIDNKWYYFSGSGDMQ